MGLAMKLIFCLSGITALLGIFCMVSVFVSERKSRDLKK